MKIRKRADIQTLFIRQQQRAEKKLDKALQEFFRDQIRSISREILTGWPALDLIWRPHKWDTKLKEAAWPLVSGTMVDGVFTELTYLRGKKTTAAEAAERYGWEIPEGITVEVPDRVVQAIQASLNETFAREYWTNINEVTRRDIERVMQQGVEQGWTLWRVSNELKKQLGDGWSRPRAKNIALTETTEALNAGHVIGMKEVETETGLPIGKEWLSVLSDTTRDAHAALDGVQVAGADGLFELNGVLIPYPGHGSLPPEDRCSCKCTVISAFVAAELE